VDKSVGAVGLYLAVLRVGAVYVPLNTAYTATELEFFLRDAEPGVFINRPNSGEGELLAAKSAGIEQVWHLGTSSDTGLWHEVLTLEPDYAIEERTGDDLAAIVYTSGTTGRSKGAMITHDALFSNAHSLHDIWGFVEGDVLLHALPIFHIHGLFVALHTAFLNASKVIFLDQFSTEEVRKYLSQATIMMGVPTFYSRLMAAAGFGAVDCENIRLFISGSAPLTEQASREWTTRTGHQILERYGMTEAGMITSNPLNGERVPGTVGYALPDVEVRVCDEEGRQLARGETGNVEVRGPNLFDGYWRLPDKTAEEVRENGYFITGDLGTMSDDGRLSIVGRGKDLIISGGFNIYPREIESVLDAIDGVAESAVVGVPHEDVGEGGVAVMVADGAPVADGEVQVALDSRLARFKHPRRFYWVEELPRNSMGKVQKNVLRDTYRDAYLKLN
jgi:malonyl-CoA/methylmalonyl-CoA synthetase